jgi:hypothetical protein
MKKLLFAGMVVMGTFAFAACGGSSNTGEGAEGGADTAAVEEPAATTTDTTTMSTDTTGTGAGATGTGADSASTGTGSGQ